MGIVSCAQLSKESDYNTPNLKKIKNCEIQFNINDAQRKIWWSWKIPANPPRCFIHCIFAALGWISSDNDISVGFSVSFI